MRAPTAFLLWPTSTLGYLATFVCVVMVIALAVFVVPSLLLMWWLGFAAEHAG